MGSILVRMGVVIGVLLGTQGVLIYVFRLTNPTVVAPAKPLEDFPLVIDTDLTGKWEGKDEKLDSREFNYSEVNTAVSRRYTNRDGRTISLLIGLYNKPSAGLYHNPFNCYHTHGFNLREKGYLPLNVSGRPDSEVSVSLWDKGGEKYAVIYWTEVGNYTMFERQDLLSTQWAMRGKAKWPPMFKVLIETSAGDPNQAKIDAMGMAQAVRKWLGTMQLPAESMN